MSSGFLRCNQCIKIQDATFELSNGTILWFSIFTLVRGWTGQKNFQSVFLGPYGTPHPYKYQAKKCLHFSFLATTILVGGLPNSKDDKELFRLWLRHFLRKMLRITKIQTLRNFCLYNILEGKACYAGLLLAPAEGFGLWPMHFWPSANSFLAFSQSFFGLWPRSCPWVMYGESLKSSPKRYLKVQEVPKGPRVPKGPKGTQGSKRYLEVQEVPKGPRGT